MSLVLIKPDAFDRGLVGLLIWEYENEFGIREMRMVFTEREQVEAHYLEHQGKVFYHDLIKSMSNRRIVVMQIGEANIHGFRPRPFTIGLRNKYGADKEGPRNLLHCSDSPEAAIREAEIWMT